MEGILHLLQNGLEILERLKSVEYQVPYVRTIVLGGLVGFGVLNCLLGYRLLRFWMMLAGFAAGALGAFAVAYRLNLPGSDRMAYAAAMLAAGMFVAGISFRFYRAGIFLFVAVLGVSLSIYCIYPRSSAAFYLCILIGVVLGMGALRFERVVVIVTTSIFGGIMAGYPLARLISLGEIPYGMLLCAGFIFAGLCFQFAVNKPSGKQKDEDTAGKEEEIRSRSMARRRGSTDEGSSNNWKGVYKGWEEEPESYARKKKARDDFYEQYFHGGDVFDRTTNEIRQLTGESDDPDVHMMAWKEKQHRRRRR